MGETQQSPDWQRTWHGLWEILGCKWTFHIVRLLSTRARGFNEMERELSGITATMLSRRLTQLEDEGVVSRTVKQTSPPSTSYELTETGRELALLLRGIEQLNPVAGAGESSDE